MAEKQYNSDTFLQSKGNIKCKWQNKNNIINGPNNYNRQTVQEIKSDHSLTTDSEAIANKCNDFIYILVFILPIKYV